MALNKSRLYVDFGASRVKYAILNDLLECQFSSTLKNFYKKGAEGNSEIPLDSIRENLRIILKNTLKKYNVTELHFSTQMHGFIIQDESGNFITDLITWQDKSFTSSDYFKKFKLEFDKSQFHKITGMSYKEGIPFFNSMEKIREKKIKSCKIISLAEFILIELGVVEDIDVDISIAASQGFYDIHQKKYSNQLLSIHNEYTDCEVKFNNVTQEIKKYNLHLDDIKLSISQGFGDLQSAINGIQNENYDHPVYVNLGTGSQVMAISLESSDANHNLETRPFFNNKWLIGYTHIPSGRVLNTFFNFFEDESIWEAVSRFKIIDLLNSDLIVDLSIFEDSYGFKNYGEIKNIQDHNFTKTNFLASILREYLNQYILIIEKMETSLKKNFNTIVLSGGIPNRLPILEKYFKYISKKQVIVKRKNQNLDETIFGLQKLVS